MSWLWSQKKFDFSRLFHVVTTTHNLGSHRMDSWWSIDPFQEVHWDSNHWGGELWKECCNVCADWGARAHCRYVYFFILFSTFIELSVLKINIKCYLPIHVFWDQEFPVNWKSWIEKIGYFLLIHGIIMVDIQCDLPIHVFWDQEFRELGGKSWICF